MEDYLNSLHELRNCYERYSFEKVMKINNINYLCSDEKVKVLSILLGNKLDIRKLIIERIELLKEKNKR